MINSVQFNTPQACEKRNFTGKQLGFGSIVKAQKEVLCALTPEQIEKFGDTCKNARNDGLGDKITLTYIRAVGKDNTVSADYTLLDGSKNNKKVPLKKFNEFPSEYTKRLLTTIRVESRTFTPEQNRIIAKYPEAIVSERKLNLCV